MKRLRKFLCLQNGRDYACVKACVSETTLVVVRERPLDRRVLLGRAAAFGKKPYSRELAMNAGSMPQGMWDDWDWMPVLDELESVRARGSVATHDAIRLKKGRLRKNAMTIVGLHGSRVRWITITVRENVFCKKDFLYMVENLRKDLHRHGFTFKYSGMIERQARGAWHLHALAYVLEDDWDYKAIQRIAVGRGMNVDMRELRNKCSRASKKISGYMLKLDAVVAAAYAAKMETGEDYCYTMTSKGCDLPRSFRIYDMRKAREFIEGYSFRKVESEVGGSVFVRYLLESEAFGRMIYYDSC